jgi:photosystem II stability/assembly factor-like uncharacterized protein
MSGSTIGGVVGGVIGWFVTGGNPAGAYWGWMIGSGVGAYVDPQQIEGPRLKDIRGQSSTVGGAIPRAWGTAPVPTNIIWQADAIEHRSTESGKGGPEQVTYTYTRSYAVMFHLGEIAGVLQIKRNGKLVYDARTDAALLAEYEEAMGPLSSIADWTRRLQAQRAMNARWLSKCTIYRGTDDQEPDPTIESYLGVGNVPAYRGRACMVVKDDDVTQEAGAIPQIEVVVAACGTTDTSTTGSGIADWFITTSRISGSALSPSEDGADWESLETINTDAGFNRSFATSRRLILWAELSDMQPHYTDDRGQTFHALPSPGGINGGGYGASYINGRLWIPAGTFGVYYTDDEGDSWTNLPREENPTFGGVPDSLVAGHSELLVRGGFGGSLSKSEDGGATWSESLRPFEPDNHPNLRCGDSDGTTIVVGGDSDALLWTEDGETYELCTVPGSLGSGAFQRIIAPQVGGEKWMAFRTTGDHSDETILTSSDGKTWALTAGSYTAFTVTGGAQCAIRHNGRVTVIGTVGAEDDKVILTTNDEGDTWVSAAHSIPGDLPMSSISGPPAAWNPSSGATPIPDAPGWYVLPDGSVQGPNGQTVVSPCAGVAISVPIAELCELSGLTEDEYDVSDLEDVYVVGLVWSRETNAASLFDALRPIGMFDMCEEDGKLKFVKRGGTAVGSINDDDLVERDGDPFEREIVQESELLRRVTIGYIDPVAGYATNTQKYERRAGTVRAVGESSSEVPAVLVSDQAATIAKHKVLVGWGEPEKQKFSLLSLRHAKYSPTDVLNYTDADGEVHQIRLMQIEDDSGCRYIEASTNCAEAYNATATGVAPKPPTVTDPGLFGPTVLVPMNLDSLRAQDNVPGMYFAASGIMGGWPGCVVEMSTDGGVSFVQIATIATPAKMGYLTDAIDTDDEPVPVFLYAGAQLSSASSAQIDAGANAAAIISSDVAEIVQFETATAGGSGEYDLTDVTRGVKDTNPASHAERDDFVLLDAAVIFVPIDVSLAGQTLVFRAPTLGTSSDSAEEVSIVYEPPTFVIDGGSA